MVLNTVFNMVHTIGEFLCLKCVENILKKHFDIMEIVQLSIAPVGIIGNLTVIVAFLNHRKLRHKISNRFIVNQVRNYSFFLSLNWFHVIRSASEISYQLFACGLDLLLYLILRLK